MAYCPTMDMLAIVNEDDELEVYRLNGQLAFTRKRKGGDARVDSICWKFNGQYYQGSISIMELTRSGLQVNRLCLHGMISPLK